MKDAVYTIVIICFTAVFSVFTLDKMCQFFTEYNKIASKIQSEKKLLERCKDPEFFMDLHTHTDVCIAVQNNARIGAFMLALHEVTGASHVEGAVSEMFLAGKALGWPLLVVGLVVLLICPSVCFNRCERKTWRYKEHDP